MRISSLGIAIAALLTSGAASAESVFAHDAVTMGEHRGAVSVDLSAGRDRFLNDQNALGVRARFDYGITPSLQLGAWVAGTYGSGMCIDARGGGGGCIDTSTSAGGLRARLGLWRSSGDLLHIGAEGGVSVRPVPFIKPIFGVIGDASVLASLKASSVGIAYGRAGVGAFHHVSASSYTPVMGTLALGFEFLPGSVHPFIEGNGTVLYSFSNVSTRIDASVLVGISTAW